MAEHKDIDPNWDDFPILDGVGTTADLTTKDGGKNRRSGEDFKVDYCNWARLLRILRQHAKGWMPGYRTWVDKDGCEHAAHREPDGSASVVVFFRAPKGSGFFDTEDYRQPLLNGKYTIQFEKASSFAITNGIKRGWCAAANAHFGLFSELWSRDELEDPFTNDTVSSQISNTPTQAQPTPAKKPQAPPQPTIAERVVMYLKPMFTDAQNAGAPLGRDMFSEWQKQFSAQFPNGSANPTGGDVQTEEQYCWTEQWLLTNHPDPNNAQQRAPELSGPLVPD